MKKFFVFMFVFLLAISFVSALEFDNWKVYDEQKREVTVTNNFGLGADLIKAQLKSKPIEYVGVGKEVQVSEIKIGLLDSSTTYRDIYTDMTFINLNNNKVFTRNFKYKYVTQVGTKTIPIREETCKRTLANNGSEIRNCSFNTVGYEEKKIFDWVEITPLNFDSLPKRNLTIGLFTEVKRGDNVEWIPNYYGRDIGEWAIWSNVLNKNIVSYWTFNETTGTNALDSVNGTFNLTVDNNWTTGIIGNAQRYSSVTTPTKVLFNWSSLGSNASINLWINVTNSFVATDRLMANPHTGAFDGFDISLGTGAITAFYNNTGFDSTIAYENDKWFMFTMTFNDTDVFIYKNGTVITNRSIVSPTWNPAAFCIGDSANAIACVGTTDKLSNTLLDEIAIYNRTLTKVEIGNLYNNGTGITFDENVNTTINVTLNFPSENLLTFNKTIIFNVSVNEVGGTNVKNATLSIWNNDGSLNKTIFKNISNVNGTLFNTTIPIGILIWNVKAEGNDGINLISILSTNRTLNSGYLLNSETHNQQVSENGDQTFTLNVTLASGLVSSDGVLIYNNTRFSATKSIANSDTIYTKTITTPDVNSNINISWTWELTTNNGGSNVVFNVTNGTQEVKPLTIDDCSVETILILNFTLKDEDNQVTLNGTSNNSIVNLFANFSNTGSSSGSTTFFQQYNSTNPIQVCMGAELLNNTEYSLDVLLDYDTDVHVLEFYNIQNTTINLTTIPKNINLFDLQTSRSQEFLFTIKDTTFLPITDALLNIKRKYVNEGVSKTVEIPKTDSLGQALGHLVLGDVIYTFDITKDGKLLGTFDNKKAVCEDQGTGDCKINLNLFATSRGGTDFQTFKNIVYTFSFNDSSKISKVVFNSLDGTAITGLLNVTRWPDQNTTLCTNSLSSSAGTISCTIPDSFGNVTGQATFYSDGSFIDSQFVTIKQKASEVFGGSRIILMILMFLTLSLMAISSPIAMVIFAIFGMGLGIVLNLIEGGSLIGVGSTLLWFVIAGGILIWKINQRR